MTKSDHKHLSNFYFYVHQQHKLNEKMEVEKQNKQLQQSNSIISYLIFVYLKNQVEMQKITEERESPQTISLNGGSMIEVYKDLQFSDEMRKSHSESSEDYRGDLSPQKLKYLGVDKFPEGYRPATKKRDASETRQDFLKKQYFSNNETRNISKWEDNFCHRKKKKISQSFSQQNQSNIESFLNSQSLAYKNYESNENVKKNNERRANNRNVLEYALKQKPTDKIKKRIYNEQKDANVINKQQNRMFEQKNGKIRDFLKKNLFTKVGQYEYLQQTQSQQSITLITLPEPQQIPEDIHRRYHKTYSLMDANYPPINQSELRSQQMIKLRFEQVKINFLDNFLPQSMKIGNNSYNFWKYLNCKRSNLQRIA